MSLLPHLFSLFYFHRVEVGSAEVDCHQEHVCGDVDQGCPLALCLSVVLKDDGALTADGFLVAAFLYYSNGSSERLPCLATD